jgi:hypothetical protein
MFDSIKCELPLPSLPQGVLDRWILKVDKSPSSSEVVFQTKDTPNQGMSMYNIDSTGQLFVEKIEGYWEEPELVEKDVINDPDSLEPYNGFLTALGKYHEISREWEKVNYTGSINFYESYNHPDKPRYGDDLYDHEDDRFRYMSGWIEYQVQLINGKVLDEVILISHELPIRLTDEELAVKKESWSIQRAKDVEEFKKTRKKYPSVQDKLIDSIYKVVNTTTKDEVSEHIVELIKDYREKFDIWYTDED